MHLPANILLQGGKYRIIRFISSGGFSYTYEAEHVLLEEKVAIKEFFIRDFCNRDETTAHVSVSVVSKKGLVNKLRRKFIEEAKALCKLQHPGIVSVSDVFEENGTAYFVMDYIDGQSLSEIISKNGPLPEERAVNYISCVTSALQYVHNNNRLHLDIKPGNIMIDGNDNPILIDFGTSKQYDELDGKNTSTLLGMTPGYAPPEQMSNSVVKFMPATDIYALGATLYQLLTGIKPLNANLRISGEEMSPLPVNITAATRNAVEAAMKINKNKRPQSLTEFLNILHPSAEDDDATSLDGQCVPKPHKFKRFILGIVLVAICAICAIEGYQYYRKIQIKNFITGYYQAVSNGNYISYFEKHNVTFFDLIGVDRTEIEKRLNNHNYMNVAWDYDWSTLKWSSLPSGAIQAIYSFDYYIHYKTKTDKYHITSEMIISPNQKIQSIRDIETIKIYSKKHLSSD